MIVIYMNSLTERQSALLLSIIRHYIATGRPLSSKFLEEHEGLEVSSATIRSEMHYLEELGYLRQVYTSGGRIPTDKAYRFFVDYHMENVPPEPSSEVRERVERVMQEDEGDIHRGLARAVAELSENLVITITEKSGDAYKSGFSGLLEYAEINEVDRMRRLAKFFEEFELLFKDLKGMVSGNSRYHWQVYIGAESPTPLIKEETLMIGRYELPDKAHGFITIVGPLRMDYLKNIALLHYITNYLEEHN